MTTPSDQTDRIAAMFRALGDPTRLRIFEFLRSCCSPVTVDDNGDVRNTRGPTAGEVCCSITGSDKISSTVSFHLKELRLAALIAVERQGRHMVCSINQPKVAELAAYLAAADTANHQCDS